MKRALLLTLLVACVYALTASGHLYSPDEEVLFRVTRSLARGEGLAIEPITDHFASQAPDPPRPDGREYAQYGAGQPIAAAPFYWLGAALGHLGGDAFWQRAYGRPAFGPDNWGFKPVAAELAPRFVCAWFNIVIASLVALMLYGLALEIFDSPRIAATTMILYAFGTMAWPHSRPFFTETLATLHLLIAWYALLRATRGHLIAWSFAAGAAAGFAALVRMDSIFFYPGMALLLIGPIRAAAHQQRVPLAAAWAAFAIPAAICCGVILTLNTLHFGAPFSVGYKDGTFFSTPLLAGLFVFLFSVGKGIFFFSPVLALGLWGWRHLANVMRARHGLLLPALVCTILVPLLMQATWSNVAGGWCWGPRHILQLHAFLMLPVAAWLASASMRVARTAALVALLTGAGVQIMGCSQDFIQFYMDFYRSPGSSEAAFIRYDEADYAYWSQFYQLSFRAPGAAAPRSVPLFPPAPIQDSLYHPQRSVWAGYPQMMRNRFFADNLWLNLLGTPGLPLRRAPPSTPQ